MSDELAQKMKAALAYNQLTKKQPMQFTLGQELVWMPIANWDKPSKVTVAGLRNGGCAVLSNGWRVDDDGVAPGTGRVLGGRVVTLEQFNTQQPGRVFSDAEAMAAIARLRKIPDALLKGGGPAKAG